MKWNITLIGSLFFSVTSLSVWAAQELSPKQAAELESFERLTLNGRFNSLYDAASAVSRKADAMGADYFYIQDTSEISNSGNWRVIADLYKKGANAVTKEEQYPIFNGIKELPKSVALRLEPFDTVTIGGYFRNQIESNNLIANMARQRGAAAFYIVRQIDTNSHGGNQKITAYIYKADAPKRQVQSPDLIPANSEAGKAALAAGSDAVETPGVASATTPSSLVGRFFETQSSSGKRYTVTLSNGTQVQELSNATALQMAPFDTIKFTGHFHSVIDMDYEVAKRAAKKGAKYYHITQQWQSKNGGNTTVSADLFK